MKKKFSFNTNATHFEPTEALWVERGAVVEKVLRKNDYAFLFTEIALLAQVLRCNGLTVADLKRPAKKKILLRLIHPKLYLRKNVHHPCFLAYRNRSFNFFRRRVELGKRTDFLSPLRTGKLSDLRILEIGCGSGRALLELQNQFPHAKIRGISLPKEGIKTSIVKRFFAIPTIGRRRPQTIEVDLNQNTLETTLDSDFDFIFSQSSLRYIRDKIVLIESVYKLLAPGGCAALEIQMLKIYDRSGKAVNLDRFFSSWKECVVYDSSLAMLFLRKGRQPHLDFKLEFQVKESKLRKAEIEPEKNLMVGWHSVYKLKK